MPASYLQRRRQRQAAHRTNQDSVFGLTVGFLLSVVSAYKYWFVIGAMDHLWLALLLSGLCVFALSVASPATLSPLQAGMQRIGSLIGAAALFVILTLWYLAFLTPTRLIGSRENAPPIYRWGENDGPVEGEGWVPKHTITPGNGSGQFVDLIAHFGRAGQWVLLPGIILLCLFGFLLFFAQTSALAPLIYTLF